MAEIAARPTRALRRRRRSRAATVAIVAALLVMAAGTALFVRAYSVQDAVLPGVSVAGIDLGGLTRAEAAVRLQAELGPRLTQPVRVSVDGHTMVVRPGKTWSLDVAATEERAYQAGRGSVFSRLGALVAPFAFSQEVEPVLDVMPSEQRAIAQRLRELTQRPVNARLSMTGKTVTVTPGTSGKAVQVDPLLDSVQAAALGGTSRLTANVETVAPSITTEEAEAVALRAQTLVAAPVKVQLKKKRVQACSRGQTSPS